MDLIPSSYRNPISLGNDNDDDDDNEGFYVLLPCYGKIYPGFHKPYALPYNAQLLQGYNTSSTLQHLPNTLKYPYLYAFDLCQNK